ncbi:hypothetical protein MPEAHAMD_4589 [Methylobacterium frigidaeris]|uniref:BrnA antitoxin of type II toxin-antitoxin system n=2 Tax=Methylobacterium frigidaeris TaxID=2038277 RepID=A0AA37HE72_9HYPH|nr:hypothetical protein MPEAHAMD_4589 [Methylobacterium frigidaeris]
MRPASEALPPEVFEALPSRGGRPKAEKRKQLVTLRLDPEVVEAFKATGPGWQTRMNTILALAVRPLSRNLDEAEAAERRQKRSIMNLRPRRRDQL